MENDVIIYLIQTIVHVSDRQHKSMGQSLYLHTDDATNRLFHS